MKAYGFYEIHVFLNFKSNQEYLLSETFVLVQKVERHGETYLSRCSRISQSKFRRHCGRFISSLLHQGPEGQREVPSGTQPRLWRPWSWPHRVHAALDQRELSWRTLFSLGSLRTAKWIWTVVLFFVFVFVFKLGLCLSSASYGKNVRL